ncbi:MAG: preprotein translocase subunit YajC [Dehalococcoidales bacterium]|jgi:preprotein translocase subunit YajC
MKKFKVLCLSSGLFGALMLGGCVPAATGTGGETNPLSLVIILVLIFAMFYFLAIRPQRRRQKDQQKLLQELKKGDRVITVGGIYGVVESSDEESVVIKVESGQTLRMAKGGIHHKIEVSS